MTHILAANIGGFPRIGESKDEQRHRRGLTHLQKKEISAHAFRDVEQSVILDVLREQTDAGLDEITDGLIYWPDPITFFCQNRQGIKLTSLARYLNRNFYHRLPVILTKPKPTKPILLPFYQFATAHSTALVRAVFTGPVTLAHHTASTNTAYASVSNRVKLFTDILATEIDALVKSGARLIQIDEPSVALNPSDLPLLKTAFEMLHKRKGQARLLLTVSGAPLAQLYEKLLSLPVDVLHLDFTYDASALFEKLLSKPAPMTLGFGLVNAATRNTDDLSVVQNLLREWLDKFNPPVAYVTPSASLEWLPRAEALEKLKHVSRLKKELQP